MASQTRKVNADQKFRFVNYKNLVLTGDPLCFSNFSADSLVEQYIIVALLISVDATAVWRGLKNMKTRTIIETIPLQLNLETCNRQCQ